MEELLPKDRNSRAVQVFGADGRAQLSRNRENYPLVQSRDRNTSRKAPQVLFPSLQFVPATSTFAILGWHHSLCCTWLLTQLNALGISPTAMSRTG